MKPLSHLNQTDYENDTYDGSKEFFSHKEAIETSLSEYLSNAKNLRDEEVARPEEHKTEDFILTEILGVPFATGIFEVFYNPEQATIPPEIETWYEYAKSEIEEITKEWHQFILAEQIREEKEMHSDYWRLVR
jgi:hypothetical protein